MVFGGKCVNRQPPVYKKVRRCILWHTELSPLKKAGLGDGRGKTCAKIGNARGSQETTGNHRKPQETSGDITLAYGAIKYID